MKKIIVLIIIAASFIGGCKKDDPGALSTVVDVTYPGIELKGNQYIHIPVGGSYTDEGATLTDDITGAVSDIQATASNVDNTVPGIYSIDYEAANANGFKTLVSRIVLVLDYTAPTGVGLDTSDISGDYLRPLTGVPLSVVKLEDGLYIIDKVGGSSAIPAYFTTPTPTTIDAPAQTIFGDDFDLTDESLDINDPITIKWKVVNPGFGTALRTFVKQPN